MKLAWGSRVPSWFRDRVIRLAREGGFDPSWLMACMKFESNFNPEARNPHSSASGLIQFMESTAEGLDTTIEAIRSMSSMEQLEMVDAYFRPYFGRIHSLSDCYLAILNPASIGLAEDAIIFPAGSRAALANRGLDINHDNAVSKAEAASFVAAALFNGMRPENVAEIDDTQAPAPIEDHSTPLPPVTPKEKPMFAGLLGNLLMSVIGGFAQSKQVASVIDKAGPAAPAVTALLNTILSQVAAQAGTTTAAMQADNKVAIAAVSTVQADATKLAAVEDAALAHLNAVGPLIDKMAQMDRELWKAQNEGKQVVSSIAIEEHRAGLWDMTRTLVTAAAAIALGGTAFFLGAILYQSVQGKIDTVLVALAGPLLAIAFGGWRSVLDYRFDGTKESHATQEAQRATERYREETGK